MKIKRKHIKCLAEGIIRTIKKPRYYDSWIRGLTLLIFIEIKMIVMKQPKTYIKNKSRKLLESTRIPKLKIYFL